VLPQAALCCLLFAVCCLLSAATSSAQSNASGARVTQGGNSSNWSINVAQIGGVAPNMGAGNSSTGTQRVVIATDQAAIATTTSPASSGGLSFVSGTIGATKTTIKGSAGNLYGWYLYNPNSSVAYCQIFNATTGSVTLGTTTPDLALAIPATSGANLEVSNGLTFATAISFACTTTRTGSTGPSSTIDYNWWYK
jgi:hypothetical protein